MRKSTGLLSLLFMCAVAGSVWAGDAAADKAKAQDLHQKAAKLRQDSWRNHNAAVSHLDEAGECQVKADQEAAEAAKLDREAYLLIASDEAEANWQRNLAHKLEQTANTDSWRAHNLRNRERHELAAMKDDEKAAKDLEASAKADPDAKGKERKMMLAKLVEDQVKDDKKGAEEAAKLAADLEKQAAALRALAKDHRERADKLDPKAADKTHESVKQPTKK